jgi:hypothetical protein
MGGGMSAKNFILGTLKGLLSGVATPVNLPFMPDWIYFHGVTGIHNISFDNGPTFPAVRGAVIPLSGVQNFTVTPTTLQPANGGIINYWVGTGIAPSIIAPRERINNIDTFIDVSCGAGAVTQICGANQFGTKTYVAVPAGAAGPLRIGKETVSASHGVLLQPGAPPYAFSGAVDLYAYNAAAGAVLATMTVERSL